MKPRSVFWLRLLLSSFLPFLFASTAVLITTWQTHRSKPSFDFAVKTLYAARSPLLSQRRLSGLGEVETKMLEEIEAALDVLEMMEHFRLKRPVSS